MLSLQGKPFRHGDGVTRRNFLSAGMLTIGGLTLVDLLRAEAAAGVRSSHKAIIHVHLDGGPPHMDMIDLKPEAPVEIRGEFTGISTALPGYQICEHMPQLAAMADRLVFIRSLVDAANAHNAFQCQSGFNEKDLQSIGGRPAMGCVMAKLRGSPLDVAPSFVDLMQGRPFVRNSARPGFLGPAYQAFRPDISSLFERPLEEGMKRELAARGDNHATRLTLLGELTTIRLRDRTSLLGDLDRLRRAVDSSGMMDAMDSFTQQAVGILTSGRFAAAMDLAQEDPRVLARYSIADPDLTGAVGTSEGAPAIKKFLLARRLVEAGVRCVSISLSDFDTHSQNFPRMRRLLPIFDHGLATLLSDLEERGLSQDVTIVCWGEFGRTPTVDVKTGGRHHWPSVGMALLAGGGMRTGQVIGETDRLAGSALSRAVSYKEVFATLYHNLGINAREVTLTDPSGRPQYLLDEGEPLKELL